MTEHTEGKLPKELKTIIVDTENAIVVRIATEPRTTETGIANIICQGIDRESRDYIIRLAKHLVLCWNSHKKLQAKADSHDTLLAACENALVTIRIMSIPCKDDSVANNNELLSIMANSFEQAIAEAKDKK